MTGAQPSVCRDKTTVCAPVEFGTLPWNEAPNGPACVSFSRTEALNELPSKANGPAHAHLGQLELHALQIGDASSSSIACIRSAHVPLPSAQSAA